MPKKGVRVKISGRQRQAIDVELMTHAIIALGRELDARKPKRTKVRQTGATTTASTGTGS